VSEKKVGGWWLEKFVTVAIISGVALLLFWWQEVADVTYAERKVLTPLVRRGEDVVIRIATNKPSNCPASVRRSIVDSDGREFFFAREERPLMAVYLVRLHVPDDAAPGKATYRAVVARRCNPLQRLFPAESEQPPLMFIVVGGS
jgi:hypothetical protein